jgi:hypothetical protein
LSQIGACHAYVPFSFAHFTLKKAGLY